MALSDQLSRRVGKRTKIKYDESGRRVGGGTLITDELVEKARQDESDVLVILEDNTEQIQRAMNQAIAAALEEIGLAGERFAKEECPVDTGRLRNSITHALDMGDNSVYIGTNVEYGPYVENGVHGRDGAHFLRNAAQNHGEYYRGVLQKHLGSA